MLNLILYVTISFIVCCNLYVAHTMTTKEMKYDFITEQGIVGTICANLFYALAWALKGIKAFIK